MVFLVSSPTLLFKQNQTPTVFFIIPCAGRFIVFQGRGCATRWMLKIAILGAGPAGLSCAIALGHSGHDVTLIERHPSLAPVGAGILIQPSGLRALEQLGVLEQFNACSVPIRRLVGRNHRGWNLVDVPYGSDVARGVSRPALNEVLRDRAVSVGAKLLLGREVFSISEQSNGVEVVLAGQLPLFSTSSTSDAAPRSDAACERLLFDAVIIASGSGSRLAAQLGLAAPSTQYPWGALNSMFEVDDWATFDELQQRFHGPRKMFGLLPTGERGGRKVLSFFWSMPVDQLQAWKLRNIGDWKQELLALWPQSAPVVDQFRTHDQFNFAVYRHARPKRLAQGRVCVVGDAAHAMSPQLGLGTTLAMGDALALAKGLAGTHPGRQGARKEAGVPGKGQLSEVAAGLLAYEELRLTHVKRTQLLSRALTPCFQADLPAWWRDLAFAGSLYVPGSRWLMMQGLKG